MGITVSIKVRKELSSWPIGWLNTGLLGVDLLTFNILIEKGLNEVMRGVEFWEQIYRDVEGWKSRASRPFMMD